MRKCRGWNETWSFDCRRAVYRFLFTKACISRVGSSVRNDSPNTLTLRFTDSVSGNSSHCRNSAFCDRSASGPHSSSMVTRCSISASKPPAGGLDAEIEHLVTMLLECGPEALRSQKALLRQWEELPLTESVNLSVKVFGESFLTDEPTRLMQAFVNRKR